MCGLYKNLFRHFLKEQASKLVDCHNYNLRLDPTPSPEIKDEQAARRPKRIKFFFGGGRDEEGPSFPLSKKVWQVARA